MSSKRGTVLVVDDEHATVELIADFLGGKQLTVARAHTLDQALAELEHARPECILLSLGLADVDGLEALKRIRQVNVSVSIVVIAGPADAARAKEALAFGAFDYILKPIDFDFLTRVVDKALQAGVPVIEYGGTEPAVPASSPQTLLYTLALEIFRATRPFTPEGRASVGNALEQAALSAMQRGVSGEKAEVIRALNQLRNLIRFARDLGDLSGDTAESLDAHVTHARRSVGLS
jgi:CheY-like chemotaxis protein